MSFKQPNLHNQIEINNMLINNNLQPLYVIYLLISYEGRY